MNQDDSKDNIQVESGTLESCFQDIRESKTNPEEINSEEINSEEINSEEINSEEINSEEINSEESDTSQFVKKTPSLLTILGLSTLVIGFLGSILININLLSQGDAITNYTSDYSFMWVVLIAAMLITAASLGVSFWLYYVRVVYLKNGPALVPEKWGVLINNLRHDTNKSSKAIHEKLYSVIEASYDQRVKSEALLESFLTLQDTITNRDNEIARLKKGHDSKIFKRFITRFIKVSISLEEIREEARDSTESKNYNFLCRKIQNALEECGVEQFIPTIGFDYRELGPEVDDDPKVLEIEDPSKNFQIASVESPAYIIEGEGDREIILPAKVTIFRSLNEGVIENV